ncbi:hypothetical protein CGRA01v4_15103 [Colletotrichum graminicola]|uniref:Uncharacterized protein n=1 Tax=Colletotrichum graminicola (strain M1.001 / M2 / FGSC 10212) TaxID=645133 RepID=E3R0A4_COLGM|nr:uncharacterized protein GLRG_11677 [Colletotrichum graminicola M1.001]EFQ36542.1 hypothetical protein GLRG_11677 [Colletotrichum graminicola M1.001]WDK23811.1 hypothetical protein CGRA01v4_15103 [Colletotrichum graminicola]
MSDDQKNQPSRPQLPSLGQSNNLINATNYHQYPTDDNLQKAANSFRPTRNQLAAFQVHTKHTSRGVLASYKSQGLAPTARDTLTHENLAWLRNHWPTWDNGLLDMANDLPRRDLVSAIKSIATRWLKHAPGLPLSDLWADNGIITSAIQSTGGGFTLRAVQLASRRLNEHFGIAKKPKSKSKSKENEASPKPTAEDEAAEVARVDKQAQDADAAANSSLLAETSFPPYDEDVKPRDKDAASPLFEEADSILDINWGQSQVEPLAPARTPSPPPILPGTEASDSEYSVDGVLGHLFSRAELPLQPSASKYRAIRRQALADEEEKKREEEKKEERRRKRGEQKRERQRKQAEAAAAADKGEIAKGYAEAARQAASRVGRERFRKQLSGAQRRRITKGVGDVVRKEVERQL